MHSSWKCQWNLEVFGNFCLRGSWGCKICKKGSLFMGFGTLIGSVEAPPLPLTPPLCGNIKTIDEKWWLASLARFGSNSKRSSRSSVSSPSNCSRSTPLIRARRSRKDRLFPLIFWLHFQMLQITKFITLFCQ